MKRCNKCNVNIADNTEVCPLCHQVLPQGEGEQYNMYPDVGPAQRKFRLAENIVLFSSLVFVVAGAYVEYMLTLRLTWTFVAALGLIYVNSILRVVVTGRAGYRSKTLIMTVLGIVFIAAIDYLTGYSGWAFDYCLPGIIIGLDIGVFVLIFVNHRNWQSYILFEIFNVILSIVPQILIYADVIHFPLLSHIALFVSASLFIGTIIIGDRRARAELYRRFHV